MIIHGRLPIMQPKINVNFLIFWFGDIISRIFPLFDLSMMPLLPANNVNNLIQIIGEIALKQDMIRSPCKSMNNSLTCSNSRSKTIKISLFGWLRYVLSILCIGITPSSNFNIDLFVWIWIPVRCFVLISK